MLVLAVGGAGIAYAVTRNQADAAYFQAVEHSLSLGEDERPYIAFDVASENFELDGELQGNMAGDSGKYRMNFEVDGEVDGLPLKMAAEAIGVVANSNEELYIKYTEISTDDTFYDALLQAQVKPYLNQWMLSPNGSGNDEDTPTSFEEDGVMATFNIAGVFAPLNSMNSKDREAYMAALKEYEPYTVDKSITKTSFNNKPARKLDITLHKEQFKQFEAAAEKVLSDDAEFENFDDEFVDQFFGGKNTLTAEVYMDEKKNEIVGVSYAIDLEEQLKDPALDGEYQSIQSELVVDYSKDLQIDIPETTLNADEVFGS